MIDAYDEEVVGERERTVLRLHPQLAPVKAAILPLIGKDSGMVEKARGLYEELRRHFSVEYDDNGAIGRRYRRQDEIGTPYGLTIDEQTLEDGTVTVRDRDSLAQERLPLEACGRGSPTHCSATGRRPRHPDAEGVRCARRRARSDRRSSRGRLEDAESRVTRVTRLRLVFDTVSDSSLTPFSLANDVLAGFSLEQALAGREAELLVEPVRVGGVQHPAAVGERALVDGEADQLGAEALAAVLGRGRRRRRGRRARRRARRRCASSRRASRRRRTGRRSARRGRSARPSPSARGGSPSTTPPR